MLSMFNFTKNQCCSSCRSVSFYRATAKIFDPQIIKFISVLSGIAFVVVLYIELVSRSEQIDNLM